MASLETLTALLQLLHPMLQYYSVATLSSRIAALESFVLSG